MTEGMGGPEAPGIGTTKSREGGERRERLFVGVPLPEGLLPLVERAQEAIPDVPGLRLIRPEQLHVTLAFIGPVGAPVAGRAREVVAGVPSDLGGLAELGDYLLLPSAGRARVVSLALADRDDVFARLFEHVMGGLEREGVMQREKRPFRPHLTIARLKQPAKIRPTAECGPTPFPVQSVCLYRSDLRPSGAQYTVLVRTDLRTDNGSFSLGGTGGEG